MHDRDVDEVDVLANVPIFAPLDREARMMLAAYMKTVQCGKGATILAQTDTGTTFYLVKKGRVKVVLCGDNGREVILAVLGPGEFFGEMSLLDRKPASASVVAMGACQLLALDRRAFVECVANQPTMAISILSEVSNRLRQANDRIGSLVLMDVYGRVAHALLELGRREGERIGETVVIWERPTHRELASMVGTSRETVSRIVSDLQRDGYLRITGHRMVLLRPGVDSRVGS